MFIGNGRKKDVFFAQYFDSSRKEHNFAIRYDNLKSSFVGIYATKESVGGEYQSGQLGRTVNPLTYVFTGSNPVSPTIYLGGK